MNVIKYVIGVAKENNYMVMAISEVGGETRKIDAQSLNVNLISEMLNKFGYCPDDDFSVFFRMDMFVNDCNTCEKIIVYDTGGLVEKTFIGKEMYELLQLFVVAELIV